MDRFDFDEEEFEGEYVYGEDDEITPTGPAGSMFMMIPQGFNQVNEVVQMAQTGIVLTELNQRLLGLTLQILEKSWFWRWKSAKKKLEMIQKTYIGLNSIIDETYRDEE
jgi:hypothetical protein